MVGNVVLRDIGFFVIVLTALGGSVSAVANPNRPTISTMAQDHGRDRNQDQVDIAAINPEQSPGRSPPSIEPFGLDTAPVVSGELFAKWGGVQAEIRAEREILARCHEIAEPCPTAAQKFLAIVADGRARTGRARIGVINRAINLAIRPVSDLRWTAPLATLTTGVGDCKDYAIAKYVALREAGVAADNVRLLIVRNLVIGEDHAVVAVRLIRGWIILDNRWLALIKDIEMRRVIPLFALDQEGVREFAMQDARRALPPLPAK